MARPSAPRHSAVLRTAESDSLDFDLAASQNVALPHDILIRHEAISTGGAVTTTPTPARNERRIGERTARVASSRSRGLLARENIRQLMIFEVSGLLSRGPRLLPGASTCPAAARQIGRAAGIARTGEADSSGTAVGQRGPARGRDADPPTFHSFLIIYLLYKSRPAKANEQLWNVDTVHKPIAILFHRGVIFSGIAIEYDLSWLQQCWQARLGRMASSISALSATVRVIGSP